MYNTDMSNKHKRRLVAFCDLCGDEMVIVCFDTMNKFLNWMKNSIGITSYGLYNEGGNKIISGSC
jgi:hypothetical protein